MTLAMMQPYFLPYIGYLQLMACADTFVIFDTAQYISKGWINRNRILHPDEEKAWQYISLPIRNKSNFARIIDMEVVNEDFLATLIAKLDFLKKRAPFYSDTKRFIEELQETARGIKSLVQVNTALLEKLIDYLGIGCKLVLESSMSYDRGGVAHAGQWALEVADVLGADAYINPESGQGLFSRQEFSARQIDLRFLRSPNVSYAQGKRPFTQNLSIIDVLLWNGRAATSEMVRSFNYI